MKNTSYKDYMDIELFEAFRKKDFQFIVKNIIENSDRILDIGCGIGDYLKYTDPGQRVVAVEP